MFVLSICIWAASACHMQYYDYQYSHLCEEQREAVVKTIGRGFAVCHKKGN